MRTTFIPATLPLLEKFKCILTTAKCLAPKVQKCAITVSRLNGAEVSTWNMPGAAPLDPLLCGNILSALKRKPSWTLGVSLPFSNTSSFFVCFNFSAYFCFKFSPLTIYFRELNDSEHFQKKSFLDRSKISKTEPRLTMNEK